MTPRQSELHNVYEIDIHIFKLGKIEYQYMRFFIYNDVNHSLNAITYAILTSVTVKTIPSEKSTRSPDVAKH
jgi:hypothetical protein